MKTSRKYMILTPTGWSNFSGIRRKHSTNVIKIDDGIATLKCTKDHLIKIDGNFTQAQHLIEKFTITDESSQDVYDILDVELNNEYITNGFISHNCAWLGSSGTLISGAVLKTLVGQIPIKAHDGLKMYFEPDPLRKYTMTVDTSQGKGLDYSSIQIIDITEMPYQQVCTFKNNLMTPGDFSELIFRMSKTYHDATILIELNDVGHTVAETIYNEYEAETLISTESAGARGKRISAGFGKSSEKGIRVSKSVKGLGCSVLKLLIEQRQLIINDHDTIHELSRFSKKANSYEAESGAHDDLVMPLVIFAWMTDQQYFKDLTDINTLMKLRDKTEDQLMNELSGFGFVDDGSSYHQEEDTIIDMTTDFRQEFRGLF